MVETLKAGAAEVYVVHSAVLDLAGPVGVGKRLLAEGYHIRESGLDDSLRLNGIIELALNEERHCDAFLAQAREGRGIDLNDLFRGFRDDFGGTLLISLLSGLFIFLWSLLLFIPGIVKAYAYSMVYYVKADHPEYGWRECLDESQRLMTGHKWEKFVLDLSFIGWGIVGSLCLGVGTLWVMTYMAATEAQYYEYLTSGRTSPEF